MQLLRRYRHALLVNPGSVGLPLRTGAVLASPPASGPRVARWAEYAVVEGAGSALGVELRRVPVDVRAVEESARLSGMPYHDSWATGLERRIARKNEEAIDRR